MFNIDISKVVGEENMWTRSRIKKGEWGAMVLNMKVTIRRGGNFARFKRRDKDKGGVGEVHNFLILIVNSDPKLDMSKERKVTRKVWGRRGSPH